MINHKKEVLISTFEKSKQSEMQVAANSMSAIATTKKVLTGSTNVNLGSLAKIADYLGLDVEIRYTRKKEEVSA